MYFFVGCDYNLLPLRSLVDSVRRSRSDRRFREQGVVNSRCHDDTGVYV